MTIKEKILTFIDAEGIKKSDFFEAVGIVPSNFKGAAKQSELGGDKIARILSLYPRLSAEWLMRGVGDMIIDGDFDTEQQVKIQTPEIPNSAYQNTDFIDKMMMMLADKDKLSREQAEEIGVLKERVRQLESEKNEPISSPHLSPRVMATSTPDL